MKNEDNCFLSVGCIVIKDNKVLLVRHTYGNANGKLLIPGGYCHMGELPEETAAREVFEETGVKAEAQKVLAVRACRKEWYLIMELKYIAGIPMSDNNENNEALFLDIDEAIGRDDVTEISKIVLRKLIDNEDNSFDFSESYREHKGNDYSLYI